jgi:hypothetical protein
MVTTQYGNMTVISEPCDVCGKAATVRSIATGVPLNYCPTHNVIARQQGRGEVIVGLTPDERMVILQWQDPDWWVQFTPDEARQLARLLLKKAEEALS